MTTIDITRILSQDLKSRSRANDLLLFIKNSNESEVTMLDSVSKTQTKVKTIPPTSEVVNFTTVDEMLRYLKTVAF